MPRSPDLKQTLGGLLGTLLPVALTVVLEDLPHEPVIRPLAEAAMMGIGRWWQLARDLGIGARHLVGDARAAGPIAARLA